MKVILLTNQMISQNTFVFGGWIQSLINVLQHSTKLTIAIAGLTEEANSNTKKENNITYYKIRRKKHNPLKRIYLRWKNTIQEDQILEEYISSIQDFGPDIVHIFGTESFLCNVIPVVEAKTVVHIQGILNPYLNAWFPPGFSKKEIKRASFTFFNFIRAIGPDFEYINFKKRAVRELKYFKQIKYVMGRTDWDKSMVSLLGEHIQYFHVEESLRSDFYTDKQWQIKDRDTIHLVSVLSASVYKGFDLILKTATLLKSKNIPFNWTICGTYENDPVIRMFEKVCQIKFYENNIIFTGEKTSAELIPILLDSDIFIHPSYIENSPNSICEAQILGIPVIATNTGGISSLIKDQETGLLVPTNDPYLLADSILSLKHKRDKMIYLGMNARKAARERHNPESILLKIESVYSRILEQS